MRCPYLEEVVMCYCQAYPVKKMIPASSSQLTSPCYANLETCPIHKDIKNKKQPLTQPPEPITAESQAGDESAGKQKYCVWLREEMVSYRLCTRDYDCQSCPFEQMLIERDGKYVEPPHSAAEMEKLKRLPGNLRRCKYTVTSKTLTQPCNMNYECWNCATYKEIRVSIVEKCLAEVRSK
jgi:hypothetical protein